MNYFSLVSVNFKHPSLSWVRFVAISFVLMRHAQIQGKEFSGEKIAFLLNGWLGVDLFFVLSGFLISSNLLNSKVGLDFNKIKLFYFKRAFRTFPAYFFILFLVCLFSFYGYGVDFNVVRTSLLDNIFFLQDYSANAVVVTFWSIAVEEKFYLVAPFLMVFIFSSGSWKVKLLLLLLIPIVGRLLIVLISQPDSYADFFWKARSPLHFSMDGLLIGVFMGILNYQNKFNSFSDKTWRLILFLSVICSLGVMSASIIMSGEWYYASMLLFIMPLLFGAIISALVALNIRYSPKWVVSISTLSYSLYLVHYPLIPVAKAISLFTSEYGYGVFVFYVAYVLMSFLAALSLHYLVEKPFLLLKEKILV